MKKITILTLLTILFPAMSAMAAHDNIRKRIKITGLNIEMAAQDVDVTYRVEVERRAVPRNSSVVLMPVISSGEWKQSLYPIVIYGPGSKVVRERHVWASGETPMAYEAGNGTTLNITQQIPFQGWMVDSELVLESVIAGCCSYQVLENEILASDILHNVPLLPNGMVYADVKLQEQAHTTLQVPLWAIDNANWKPVSVADTLATTFEFVLPESEYDEARFAAYDEMGIMTVRDIELSRQLGSSDSSTIDPDDVGRYQSADQDLAIYFHVGSSRIDPQYMNNERMLSNLVTAIEMIARSPDSKVARVVIAGFASPEGGTAINEHLAQARAEAVSGYIAGNTSLETDQIQIHNNSVAWDKLRAMVARSDMEYRDEVLNIIDTAPVWDARRKVGRLGQIMRLDHGNVYRYMLKNFFPYLRMGAYIRVYYENL